jgi:lambda repressor-like predicted transcriptional regulator
MHWADIIAAIHKANSSLSSIAQNEGVSPSMVSNVVRDKYRSHKVAYAVAAVTGIPTEKMWPGRYLTPPAYRDARKGNDRGRLPKAASG